jgi:hypothetical protein
MTKKEMEIKIGSLKGTKSALEFLELAKELSLRKLQVTATARDLLSILVISLEGDKGED